MENQLMSLLTIFVSMLLVILMRSLKSRNSSRNLPPGPWRLPIIGNMHQLVGSLPHYRLTELAMRYGPIMHLQLGQLSHVVISSPELAEEVMKTHDLVFASRPFILAASVIAYNSRDIAFSPYGEYWRQLRKICTQELLGAKRVHSFQSIREEEVSRLINSIRSSSGTSVNLSKMLIALSYCITSRTTLGHVRIEQIESFTPVVDEILCLLGGFNLADLFPSIKLFQVITGMRSKLQKLHREADAILEEIIREHKERSKSADNNESDDLVNVLLNLQGHDMFDASLTTQEIKAVLLDMFLAGYEPSATALEWTMSELVKHPEIIEKAQAEIRRVFDGKEKVEEASFNDLIYMKSVIKESLRLHPPGPLLLPREAQETVEICGYEIPEKSRIIINGRAILRDCRYWSEPERFKPERFMNSWVDYKGTNFEFIPFGAGRRICPGMLYATSVVEIAIANLLYHFDWKISNEVKPEHLDMSETFGVAARRKTDLLLIPTPYRLPSAK